MTQRLSYATIRGPLDPTVPTQGPAKAQKAKILAHCGPQNENLGENSEKFKFPTYKGHLESIKMLSDSI